MKRFILACKVFFPETEFLRISADSEIEVEYLDIEQHNLPDQLRKEVQRKIDAVSGDFDEVLLFYGLCGNGLSGIRARQIPLVIPRAHDCSGVLLGSFENHQRFFAEHPSRAWCSAGSLLEDPSGGITSSMGYSKEYLIAEYGEENGLYLFETLTANEDPDAWYLDIPEVRNPVAVEEAKRLREASGKRLIPIPGTIELLRAMLRGEPHPQVLRVSPGQTIRPSYDEQVLHAVEEE